MDVFFTPSHEIRSGWKFLAYIVIFMFLWVITALVLGLFFAGTPILDVQLTMLALNAGALAIPAVLTLVIMARAVEHKPAAAFGAALHEKWPRDLSFGIALAAGMLSVLVAGAAAFGRLEIRWTAGEATGGQLLLTFLVLSISAANEELVFRGYPLQVLMKGIGVWPAVMFMSVVFAMLHATNPNVTHLGLINTALAGVLLSIAYVKTRSLWLPYGIHVGWNMGLGFIMGFPLSGLDIPSIWASEGIGAESILGGHYGPEGGLLMTVIFLAAVVTIHTVRVVEVSPKMRALTGETQEGETG